jgi:CHASE2 domain-containing sensor protein
MRFPKSLISINPPSLTLGTLLAVVVLFSSGTPMLDWIESKTCGLRFLSHGRMPPSPAVVVAAIDERSLDVERRWPWPMP